MLKAVSIVEIMQEWGQVAQDSITSSDLADLAQERIEQSASYKEAGARALRQLEHMADTLDMLSGVLRDLDPPTLAWFAGVVQACNYDRQMRLDHVIEIVEQGQGDLMNLVGALDIANRP